MREVEADRPIWFLRAALSGVLFSIVFFGMGYTDPTMRFDTYLLGAANLLIVAGLVAAYWYWPRSSIQRKGEDAP